MNTTTFASSGNAGDLIYALSSIQDYCWINDTKAVIYLRLDRPATYQTNTHPLGNVMLNKNMFDMLYPLLKEQDYIHEVIALELGEDYPVQFDLDLFRNENKNLSAGDIKLWHSVVYPELRPATAFNCLYAEPIKNDYTIVNRTQRYNNPLIDYSILEGKKVMFVGVDSEYKIFKMMNPFAERLEVKDFLELAQYIAGCELFIGNQSMAFAIAEQLKVKRILEQFVIAPNVIPQGGDWSIFHTQNQFQKLINSL